MAVARIEINGRSYESVEAVAARIAELDAEYPGQNFDDEARDEWNALNEVFDELKVRGERIRELARDPRRVEAALEPGGREVRADRDRALGTIERHRGALSAEAGDRLEALVRGRDPVGIGARYLTAVGDPHYESAFGKLVQDPTTGHLRFSPDEVEAVRTVSRVQAERAMNETTGSAGQFAVPFALDPSIILTSSGAINPVRQIASVETIAVDVWKGVSSDGVTAAFGAEATEATDASPTLVQPSIDSQKAFAFVPFSIELGQDWPSLQNELGRLFADAKDVLEATKFLTGTGSNEPGGILNIGGTGGLTTTQRVQTTSTASFALADVYSLKQALPARFIPRASFAWHPNRIDTIYRFVGGNSTEPPLMPSRDGALLGRPNYEWSAMATATTSGTKIGVVGDWSGYKIVDRIGGSIELIPHLFGATNRFPTGQRGLYYFWRVGAGVVAPNAFRYLEAL